MLGAMTTRFVPLGVHAPRNSMPSANVAAFVQPATNAAKRMLSSTTKDAIFIEGVRLHSASQTALFSGFYE